MKKKKKEVELKVDPARKHYEEAKKRHLKLPKPNRDEERER